MSDSTNMGVNMWEANGIFVTGRLPTYDRGKKCRPGVVTGRGAWMSLSSSPSWSSSKFQDIQKDIGILSQKNKL